MGITYTTDKDGNVYILLIRRPDNAKELARCVSFPAGHANQEDVREVEVPDGKSPTVRRLVSRETVLRELQQEVPKGIVLNDTNRVLGDREYVVDTEEYNSAARNSGVVKKQVTAYSVWLDQKTADEIIQANTGLDQKTQRTYTLLPFAEANRILQGQDTENPVSPVAQQVWAAIAQGALSGTPGNPLEAALASLGPLPVAVAEV